MTQDTFRALVLRQEGGSQQAQLEELRVDDLPPGDVLVTVSYSSLNYKDGLAVSGTGKVIRSFPMIPGIDLAGVVRASAAPGIEPGDQVIVTGWGVGERHWGGYAQMARVRGEWVVSLPQGLSLRHAMGIGTAGFTAMLCVMALEDRGLTPASEREVLVTGAAGGVGSIAVALLAHLGHKVAAVTGRPEVHDYLRALGATSVYDRSVVAPSGRPLESERWGSCVDTVGGEPLAALLPAMAYGSAVAACGNAAGLTLATTVFPFILRGVSLVGIDSAIAPQQRRVAAWQRLAQDLPADALERIAQEAPLNDVPRLSTEILAGRVRGRTIVDVNA